MSFRASPVALAQRSSKEWLARQNRDSWVKQRAENDYYSRSAFKLLEIAEQYGSFLEKPDVKVVVDLGAAPGGWSQAAARKLGWDTPSTTVSFEPKKEQRSLKTKDTWGRVVQKENIMETYDPLNIDDFAEDHGYSGKGRAIVVAVDLLPVKPIRGVESLKANFLDPRTEDLIQGVLQRTGFGGRKADVILSDIAANITGVAAHDNEACLQVCHAVFKFTQKNLRTGREIGRPRGGVLLLKHFAHPDVESFKRTYLTPNFRDVLTLKPRASRSESKEAYYLCRGFHPQALD
ncbi:ribosomal rna large subunit methyltransferase j [Moniliophthora roreri MCA 2997]|uniref:rRNA methyltransferase 2, mitochondrial n=2 Tax=Moniliophthora roreri TaxID=221103 RepID=V2X9Q8_MONRO|nr:ribosomal rna large subunit methyltransferase j [Moniliophthora roreri MCA 2997]KAI3615913.1 ribosomal rna large subunit methyltransferase j [Moniliophthora roreri]